MFNRFVFWFGLPLKFPQSNQFGSVLFNGKLCVRIGFPGSVRLGSGRVGLPSLKQPELHKTGFLKKPTKTASNRIQKNEPKLKPKWGYFRNRTEPETGFPLKRKRKPNRAEPYSKNYGSVPKPNRIELFSLKRSRTEPNRTEPNQTKPNLTTESI